MAWPARMQWLAQAVMPARCLLCDEPGSGGLQLCDPCHLGLPWLRASCPRCALPLPAAAGACGACLAAPPPAGRRHAALVYRAPVDQLLLRFKFHGDLAAGSLLAMLMAQAMAGAERPQALVPMPLHRSRLRQRGYDQALELARPLARALQLPLQAGLLARVRATAPQSRLDAPHRQGNVRQAFAARPTTLRHVALVDDVMTTGATADAAASALQRAGVARVDVWVCARVP